MIRHVFTLLVFYCIEPIALTQTLPTPEAVATAESSPRDERLLLRIPASMISKSVNRDFNHIGAVNQILLGTSSIGTSDCVGHVSCVVEDNASGVSILCRITGTVKSETRGTNGPAIICSTALTKYIAVKRLTFDGRLFAANPASVTSCTSVTITRIGSTMPRLAGRLVKRVAANKAQNSHAEVEAIVKLQTEAELCQRIDVEFDARVAGLNRQFANRLSILKYFPGTKPQLRLRSKSDGVELALCESSQLRIDIEDSHPSIGESLEIWLKRSENLVPTGTMTKILFKEAPTWLSKYLSETPGFLDGDGKNWSVDVQEKWIVVKLHQ